MWLLIHAGIKVKTMLVKGGPGSRPPHFNTENILWDIEAIYTLKGQEGYFLLKYLSVVQIATQYSLLNLVGDHKAGRFRIMCTGHVLGNFVVLKCYQLL